MLAMIYTTGPLLVCLATTALHIRYGPLPRAQQVDPDPFCLSCSASGKDTVNPHFQFMTLLCICNETPSLQQLFQRHMVYPLGYGIS